MRIGIVTLFPDAFASPLGAGLLQRAQAAGRVEFRFANPRDFTTDRHRSVDDYAYGGGPGMILRPEPVVEAVESLSGGGNPRRLPIILMSPQGERLTQAKAAALAARPEILFVCGRYKAIDERVRQLVVTEELSVGDYVLSGGEIPCLVAVDAIVRLLPGAMGDEDSAASDSFSPGWNGGLDCAYYPRPAEYRGLRVPEVLLAGHHERIAAWRAREATARTRARRPELLQGDAARVEEQQVASKSESASAPDIQGRNPG